MSAASASASSGSSSLSSVLTVPTSAISRCFSSPSALPIALEAWFCVARSSSTRTVSSLRVSSAREQLVDGLPHAAARQAQRGRAPGLPGVV